MIWKLRFYRATRHLRSTLSPRYNSFMEFCSESHWGLRAWSDLWTTDLLQTRGLTLQLFNSTYHRVLMSRGHPLRDFFIHWASRSVICPKAWKFLRRGSLGQLRWLISWREKLLKFFDKLKRSWFLSRLAQRFLSLHFIKFKSIWVRFDLRFFDSPPSLDPPLASPTFPLLDLLSMPLSDLALAFLPFIPNLLVALRAKHQPLPLHHPIPLILL